MFRICMVLNLRFSMCRKFIQLLVTFGIKGETCNFTSSYWISFQQRATLVSKLVMDAILFSVWMLTAFTKQQDHSVNCMVKVLFSFWRTEFDKWCILCEICNKQAFSKMSFLKTVFECYLNTTVNLKTRPCILFTRRNSKGEGVSH